MLINNFNQAYNVTKTGTSLSSVPLSVILTNKLNPSEDFSPRRCATTAQNSLARVLESTSKACQERNKQRSENHKENLRQSINLSEAVYETNVQCIKPSFTVAIFHCSNEFKFNSATYISVRHLHQSVQFTMLSKRVYFAMVKRDRCLILLNTSNRKFAILPSEQICGSSTKTSKR